MFYLGPCLIFIIQGHVSLKVPNMRPGKNLRPSLQALVRRSIHGLYSSIVDHFGVSEKREDEVLTYQSFGQGQSLCILRAESARRMGYESTTQIARFEVTSVQACWTIELHEGEGGCPSWPPNLRQWRPSAVYGW